MVTTGKFAAGVSIVAAWVLSMAHATANKNGVHIAIQLVATVAAIFFGIKWIDFLRAEEHAAKEVAEKLLEPERKARDQRILDAMNHHEVL
jgi:uncharacterized membrane protein